jgi:hypothetical protein
MLKKKTHGDELMKSRMFLKIVVGLMALSLLATAGWAQCVSNVPGTLTVGQSACVRVCTNDFAYPAIQLYGNHNGPGALPQLILQAGCATATTHCNETCTAITPPSYPFVLGGDPFFPDNYYGHSDCLDIYLYWIHDNVWGLEIYTFCSGCFCITYDSQLAVSLSADLAAVPGDNSVTLTWATASETNSDRFEITRDGSLAGSVDGLGTSANGRAYTWTDNSVSNGSIYRYDLVAVDAAGGRTMMGRVNATPNGVTASVNEYALRQNYPNPFNPTTSISFDLVEANHVTLKVFNPMGETVKTLVDANVGAGRHSVSFDGRSLTSGLYFYSITVGDRYSATRKMLLVK